MAKRQNPPRRHHTTSAFLLRRFAQAPRGTPVVQRAERGVPGWMEIPTRKAAVQNDFYTYDDPDGRRRTDVEEALAGIEAAAAPIIGKLLAPPTTLRMRERLHLAGFIAFAWARTPARREITADMMRALSGKFLMDLANDDARFDEMIRRGGAREKGLDPAEIRQHLPKMRIHGDRSAELGYPFISMKDVIPSICVLHWHVLRAPQGASFVTSDTPVALADGDRVQPGELGWGAPDLRVFMPIDPAHCFLASRQGLFSEDVGIPHREATAAEVELIVGSMARVAHRYVFARDAHPLIDEALEAQRDRAAAIPPSLRRFL